MTPIDIFTSFLIAALVGIALELLVVELLFKISKTRIKTHHFYFSRYFLFLIGPICVTAFFALTQSGQIATAFLTFAAVGTTLEWLIGFAYQQVVGQRLWTYHRFPVSGYTSLLSIPLWGFAGAIFWLLLMVFK